MLRAWVASPYVVPSGSMESTIMPGQIIMVDRLSTPHRGDIAVFEDVNNWTGDHHYTMVKRIIGVGGDIVSARAGKLYVNGVQIAEPYTTGHTADFAVVVPAGTFFFVGDNRQNSVDARCHIDPNNPSVAFIPASAVGGVVRLIGTTPVHRPEALSSVPLNSMDNPVVVSGGCTQS